MYLDDLLTHIERELDRPAAEGASISERETAILAEVRRLKRVEAAYTTPPPDVRPKSAPLDRVSAVARDVIQDLLDGHSVRSTAIKWGISEPQAKRQFYLQVSAACRREINRRQALVDTGDLSWMPSILSLRFVSQAGEKRILGKARDAYVLVSEALKRQWNAADELQAFTAESTQ